MSVYVCACVRVCVYALSVELLMPFSQCGQDLREYCKSIFQYNHPQSPAVRERKRVMVQK